MSCTVREILAEAYGPDPRVTAIVAMGPSFLLVSLLSNPSSNPPYLFSLMVAVLSLIVLVVVPAVRTRR